MSRGPELARRLFDRLEPIHVVSYFAAEVREALADIGFDDFWTGYVASRSAPLVMVEVTVTSKIRIGLAAPIAGGGRDKVRSTGGGITEVEEVAPMGEAGGLLARPCAYALAGPSASQPSVTKAIPASTIVKPTTGLILRRNKLILS